MTGNVTIRPAGRGDIALLDRALRALSADLGDRHVADAACLRAAGFGDGGSFGAILALRDDEATGAALFTPLFSTTLGGPGAYVSDLWVASALRGGGLGRRLLSAVAKEARLRWGAGFIRLSVYAGNEDALAFYRRLGFAPRTEETGLILRGGAFARLEGCA